MTECNLPQHPENSQSPQRGGRSFSLAVPGPRPDRKCSLKRHFKGVERQLVGIAERLAANDPERFFFAGIKFLVEHAKHNDGDGCDGTAYGRRAVLYGLRSLRDRGVFTPAKLFRCGAWRRGYVVMEHREILKTRWHTAGSALVRSPLGHSPGYARISPECTKPVPKCTTTVPKCTELCTDRRL